MGISEILSGTVITGKTACAFNQPTNKKQNTHPKRKKRHKHMTADARRVVKNTRVVYIVDEASPEMREEGEKFVPKSQEGKED